MVLVTIGYWHRRRTVPAAADGRLTPLLRLAAGELVLMGAVSVGLALGWPIIADPRPPLGTLLLAIAWPYGLSMPVRYGVRMWRHPEARWTGRTIPIAFHIVLATWLFVLGSYLRPVV